MTFSSATETRSEGRGRAGRERGGRATDDKSVGREEVEDGEEVRIGDRGKQGVFGGSSCDEGEGCDKKERSEVEEEEDGM